MTATQSNRCCQQRFLAQHHTIGTHRKPGGAPEDTSRGRWEIQNCELVPYVNIKPLLERGYTTFRIWIEGPDHYGAPALRFQKTRFMSPEVRKQDAAQLEIYRGIWCTKEGEDRWAGGPGNDLGGCCKAPRAANDPLITKWPNIETCKWDCKEPQEARPQVTISHALAKITS